MKPCRSIGLGLLFGASLLLYTVNLLAATGKADGALPAEVVASLESTVRALDPISLEWTITRARNLPEETFFPIVKGPKWVKGDTTFLEPSRTLYKYQGGKVHIYHLFTVPRFDYATKVNTQDMSQAEVSRLPLKCVGTSPLEIDVAFDGTKFYEGNRREGGVGLPGLLIVNPSDTRNQTLQEMGDLPRCPAYFLRYAGLRTPLTMRDYQQPKIRPLAVDLLARGGRLSQIQSGSDDRGRYFKFTVATKAKTYMFDLDPAHNYAMRRLEERTPAGKPCYVASLSDFRKLPGKEQDWLPYLCVVQYYQWMEQPSSPMDKPFLVETYTVTKCESQSIAPDEFVVFYNVPGAEIGDTTLPNAEKGDHGQIRYTVPANPNELDNVIRRATQDSPPRPSNRLERRWTHVFALANLLVILVLIFWIRRRRCATLR